MTDNPSQPLALAGDPSGSHPLRSTTRKKASIACSACRARRSKCTGGVPCLACVNHRTECVKDENEDGRRRTATKRRLEALEEDRSTLEEMVVVLKHGDDSHIQTLRNIVRTNTPREDLRAFLNETQKTIKETASQNSPPLGSPLLGRRIRTGGIIDLINPPVQVPARPWTNVTEDDDYVSHLISLWLTWVHPWFHWVDGPAFVQAMQSQDLDHPLCAPYLVSSILAEACSLDAPDSSQGSYHNRLRARFAAEAKAGIEQEQGKVSLRLIQAMGVQWTSLYLDGQDRRGRLTLNSQIFLAQSLGKWRERLSTPSADQPNLLKQIDTSLNFVRWTLFMLNSFNLADYRHFHPHTKPSSPPEGPSHETAPMGVWSAYPVARGAPAEWHAACHFQSLVSLAARVVENEAMSARREKGSLEGDVVRELVQTLEDWPGQLPRCMQIHSRAMPHVLILHALHKWVFLLVAKQTAAAEAGQATQPVITETPKSSEGVYWQRLSISSAVSIASLIRNYIHHWDSGYFPPMIMPPISLALLTLMEDLHMEECKPAFITLSKALATVAHKFRVGIGVIRVIRSTAREKGIVFPPEVEHIYESYDRQGSDVEMLRKGSDQGADVVSPDSNITADYLLEKWTDLNLDDGDD